MCLRVKAVLSKIEGRTVEQTPTLTVPASSASPAENMLRSLNSNNNSATSGQGDHDEHGVGGDGGAQQQHHKKKKKKKKKQEFDE